MKNKSSLKNRITKLLSSICSSEREAFCEAELIIETVCNIPLTQLAILEELDDEQADEIESIVNTRISTQKPIQQILGKAYFYGETYKVNEHTLIPRPETELLVKTTLKYIQPDEQVLDIGTGSGCIACAIAMHSKAVVTGIDISNDALQIAIDNVTKLGLFNRVLLRKSDIFSNVTEKYNVIVSNPPYIPLSEKANLDKEVLQEPHNALFTKDSLGIEFYEKIIQEAPNYLLPKGYLTFELGQNQHPLVETKLIENKFKIIETVEDLSKIQRVIVAQMISF